MKQKYILLVIILSALVAAFACAKINAMLICIAWAPFFYNIYTTFSTKQKIKNGFVFGFVYGLFLFSWTFTALKNYSSIGNFSFIVTILLSVYYGVYYAVLSSILSWFKNKFHSNSWFFYFAIVSIFVLIEELFCYLYQGIPFLNLRLGLAFSKILYLIQLTSIGGVAVLTFLIVLINCFIAKYFFDKNKNSLYFVASVILISFFIGFLLYHNNNSITDKELNVALATGNIDPKLSWNETTGNTLAENYIALSKEAASANPDFILWPESVFPWVFDKNDDLIKEILKSDKQKEITHVFGLNVKNEKTSNEISNSAVFMSNKNKNTAKYIKNISLVAFEKPFLNTFQIPFSYSGNIVYNNKGKAQPVNTINGKIGVLICNEATEKNIYEKQVENGATCFFILSNDGWFKDTYIDDFHFYAVRLMAVSYNKDIALNSNCGTNGFIKSNGEIVLKEKSLNPFVKQGTLNLNSISTFYYHYPYLIHSFLLLFILINYFLTFKFKQL